MCTDGSEHREAILFKLNQFRFGLLASTLLTALAGSANAVTILSNIQGPVTTVGGSNLGLLFEGAGIRSKSVGLVTGTTSLSFTSLTALITNPSSGPARVLSGGIYSSVNNNPGNLLAAFAPVAIPQLVFDAQPQAATLTTTSVFTLLANTPYWFVLTGPTTASGTPNNLTWQQLSPPVEPIAIGVAYTGYRSGLDGTWANSSVFNAVAISATPVPEVNSVFLLTAGLGLIAIRLRRKS